MIKPNRLYFLHCTDPSIIKRAPSWKAYSRTSAERPANPSKNMKEKRNQNRGAGGKRLPALHSEVFLEPIGDADEQNTAGREEQNFE
jgi:hypothetical protein